MPHIDVSTLWPSQTGESLEKRCIRLYRPGRNRLRVQCALAGQTPAGAPSAKDLVKKLGSDNFKDRDAAEKDLAKMGAAAIDELKAGLTSKDDEVRSRCDAILKQLQAAGIELGKFDVNKQLLWSFAMKVPSKGGATVAKGTVFVISEPENDLVLIDQKTGAEKLRVKGPLDPLAPLVDGETAYVQAKGGAIIAYDCSGKEAKEVWRSKSPVGAALLVDGVLYAGSPDAGLFAFDARTGEVKWQNKQSKMVGSPVVRGGTMYVIGADQKAHALSLKDGSSLCVREDFSSVLMTLAISGDQLLALDFKALHGLSLADGAEKWSFSVDGQVQRCPSGAMTSCRTTPRPVKRIIIFTSVSRSARCAWPTAQCTCGWARNWSR